MKFVNTYPRSSGVLLPVTMLHGPFGIGVLGAEAMEFIDFLSEAGFHAWQVLPVEHAGMSFSPYKCVSAFAGDPLIIDPRMLLDMDLITPDELSERAEGLSEDFVDYMAILDKQWQLLKTAFFRLKDKPYSGFKPDWLDNYALYLSLKHLFGDTPWYEWPDAGLRSHDAKALKNVMGELSAELDFHRFIQWIFHKQWSKLKAYAASRGVSIVGDMPFYAAEDSAEVWRDRKLFDADADGNFLAVGGAPPDYFSPDGQHWGNPAYNWKLMKRNNYRWWTYRVSAALERYDYVRFDHFRGFESYWRIPAGAASAREGKWAKGPGIGFFKAIGKALGGGDLPMIAEDLGDITDEVEKLLEGSGFRGMRVIQFGFMGDDKHLPHNYTENCVAYTGTHDNTTMLAWMLELAPEDRERALSYIGFDGDWTAGGPNSAISKAWVRALLTSGASLAIVPIQDLLGYGADTRTNTPGTSVGNWKFRIRPGTLAQIDAEAYATLNKATCRDNALGALNTQAEN